MALFKKKEKVDPIPQPNLNNEVDEMDNFELGDFEDENFGETVEDTPIDDLGDMDELDSFMEEEVPTQEEEKMVEVTDEPTVEETMVEEAEMPAEEVAEPVVEPVKVKKGLFSKKEKQPKVKKEKKSKKDKKNTPPENYGEDFKPKFGKIEDFTAAYGVDPHVTIGMDGFNPIKVNVSKRPAREITVINDSQYSRDKQFVIPFIKQRNLSYVVYDPENFYYNMMADNMKDNGYDVQVVDFANKEHKTRIDLFEATNITQNSYWLSVIIASTLKCEGDDLEVAHALLMAMMQYLLDTEGVITIEKLFALFKHVQAKNEVAIRKMQKNENSELHIKRFVSASEESKELVIEKLMDRFFKIAMYKAKDANTFAVTAHKKKTIYFIKKTPKKYSFLLTALLFNIKATNVLCTENEVCTAIIDVQNDKWCNQHLLDRICDEAGMSHGVMELHIRENIGTMNEPTINDNQLLIFMCSKDYTTKRYVHHCMKTKTMFSETELADLEANKFSAFGIPTCVYESAPMTIDELDSLDRECIIIDITGKTKPIKCTKLN